MFSFSFYFVLGGQLIKKDDVVFISSIVLPLFQTFALNCFDVFVIFSVMISCIVWYCNDI